MSETAEQKARDLLDRMEVDSAQNFSAGDLVELANFIRDSDDMRRGVSILATFAHEVMMGAVKPSEMAEKAKLALMRSTYISLDRVVALSAPPSKP
jgi:hypothetical protein